MLANANTQKIHKNYKGASKWHKFLIICLLFFAISCFGWLLETVGFYLAEKAMFERGFLMLPFCTLYGFSTVLLYYILNTPTGGIWHKLATLPKNKLLRMLLWIVSFLLYAVAASLLATAVEYVTGAFFHHFFNLRLWNYTGFENNVNGYITLEYSVYWGVLATAGMALIFAPLKNLFAKMNYKFLAYLVLFLTVALLSDFIFNMLYTYYNHSHYHILPRVFDYYKCLLHPSRQHHLYR